MNTTDVALASYEFFTGSVPNQAGLAYLVNNPGSGFNTAYFNGTGTGASATNPGAGGFNQENRYYNEAVALGTNATTGASFRSAYGSLTLNQTIASAYETIIGTSNVGSANAQAAIASIQSSIPYFTKIAQERAGGVDVGGTAGQQVALKSVIVGYILEEALKADVGTYAKAIDQFNAAVAAGNAQYGTNILQTYGPGGTGYGTGVGANATGLGTAIALTTGTDTFSNSSGNITYVGTVGGAAPTLTAADVIQPTGANNVLLVTDTAGTDATGGALLSGLSQIQVRNISGGTSTVNAASIPSTGILTSYLSTGAVTFSNVGGTTNVNVVGNGSLTNGLVTANYVAAATAATVNLTGGTSGGSVTLVDGGSANLKTVNVNSAGVANAVPTLTASGITTLNLNASSGLKIADTQTGNNLATLNVMGTAGVTIKALSLALATVNSTNTAGLTLDASTGSTALTSVTTSTGADTLTLASLGATANVNLGGGGDTLTLLGAFADGATLNGGGGATLAVTAANFATESAYTNLAKVTGFSTLSLTTALADATTYDPTVIGATNFTTVGVTTTKTATVNLASGNTLTFAGAYDGNNGTVNVAVGSGSTAATLAANKTDVLNIVYKAPPAALTSTVTTAGVETVNVSATAPTAGSNLVTLALTDNALTTLTLSGTNSVSFTAGAAMTKLVTVDASSATAAETINVSALTGGTAAAPIKVTGGSKADTIAFKDFSSVAGNGGNDTFTVGVTTGGQTYSTITDEHAGNKIGFATAATAFSTTAISLASTAGFQDYLDSAASKADGTASYFTFGGDTYVVEANAGGGATFAAGIDTLVKLTGVHDLSTSTFSGGVITTGG